MVGVWVECGWRMWGLLVLKVGGGERGGEGGGVLFLIFGAVMEAGLKGVGIWRL